MKRASELIPLLAIGAASLIWQIASARSVLAGLYGNELVLGLVLGSWLLLMGLATAVSSRLGERRDPAVLLTLALLLLPLGVLASLVLQHAALPAFGAMDQVTEPSVALGGALLCLLPACLLLGAAFGFVALLVPAGVSPSGWAARIYLVESLGTAAAGVVFHAWLAELPLPAVGAAAGIAPFIAGLALLWQRWRERSGSPAQRVGLAAIALLGLGALLQLGLTPWRPTWIDRPVAGYEVLTRRNSSHAELTVLRRGDQVVFLANGVVLFSNQDEVQVDSAIHLAMLAHHAPHRVLMIGGGLGGGLRAVLQHPVVYVDYVELDDELVSLARRYLGKRLNEAIADKRVHLRFDDGRKVVASSTQRYDVILVGMPDPSSALLNRFYTEEFLQAARRALRPGGLLQLSLAGSETYLDDSAALVHATMRSALKRVFNNATVLPGQTTLLLAGQRAAVPVEPTVLVRRMTQRRIQASFFDQTTLIERTLPFQRQLYQQRIANVRPLVNRDLHPSVYFHASLSWLAVSSPNLARRAGKLAAALWDRLGVVLGLCFVVAFAIGALRRRNGAPGAAIFIAGLTGLALEICLLLATQEIRGVVYHEIGALLTAFMVGLGAGSPLGNKLVCRWPRRAIAISLAACGAVSMATLASLQLAERWPSISLVLFLAVMGLSGMAVGCCYPAASAAFATHNGSGRAAARAYAWDLAGAAVGALVASAFLLPVLSLPGTCLFCATLTLGLAAGTTLSTR